MLGLAPLSAAPLSALADVPDDGIAEATAALSVGAATLDGDGSFVGAGLNAYTDHFWHLDEEDFGPFVDAVSDWDLTASPGSPSGPGGEAPGIAGTAVLFSANTEKLTLSDRAGLTPAGSFSRSVWAKRDSSNATGGIIGKSDSDAADQEWMLYFDGGFIRFRVGNGTSWTTLIGSSPSADTWHLYCIYYDATNQLIGLSVDGAAFSTTSFTGSLPDGAADFTVGDPNETALIASMFGAIDEIGFYDGYVLTNADASFLFNGGTGNFYPFPSQSNAAAALVAGSATLSGSATFAAGTKTATAALAVGNTTLAAGATSDDGMREATAALSAGAVTVAAAGSVPYRATAALSIGHVAFTSRAYARLPRAYLHHFTYTVNMLVRETISGVGFGTSTIISEGFSQVTRRFGPNTNPPMNQCSYSRQTIGGGGSTDVDFTDLHGTQDAIDARGRKLRFLFVRNRGAGTLAIGPAAATPLEPFGAGNTPVFPAGATVSLFVPDGLSISDSAKRLKLTGTAAAQSDLAILVG